MFQSQGFLKPHDENLPAAKAAYQNQWFKGKRATALKDRHRTTILRIVMLGLDPNIHEDGEKLHEPSNQVRG